MYLVVGTAGHIDHGKTALVRALTGIDTDRLPEEKKRGITVDLGFADLTEGDTQISFVDVPGHERFVKNMLAGASGVDVLLLVVASDEGVMPQTREHFNICRLLGIETGIVVITKADLADAELIGLVREDITELVRNSFLEGAPVLSVSSRTGAGLSELRSLLALSKASNKNDGVIARLPIDRSFAAKGFGTVITGTLISGEFSEKSALELLPQQQSVRARGIQSHGQDLQLATAGRRTAVNLGGISHSEISRGMVLAEADVLTPASIFDVQVEVLEDAAPLRSRQRVRVHLGTAELLARIKVLSASGVIEPGANGLAQIRLESPAVAVLGERFIIRGYSPQATIAGGSIIRPTTEKPRSREMESYAAVLDRLRGAFKNKNELLDLVVASAGLRGITMQAIRGVTGWNSEVANDLVKSSVGAGHIVEADGYLISKEGRDDLSNAAVAAIKKHHAADPLSKGLGLDVLRVQIFRLVPPEIQKRVLTGLVAAGKIVLEGETVRSAVHKMELSVAEATAVDTIVSIFERAGLELPKRSEVIEQAAEAGKVPGSTAGKLFQMLVTKRDVVQVDGELFCGAHAIGTLTSELKAYAANSSDRTIDVPKFKDIAKVSRKFAIPLLEYFDREKVTVRAGDKRVII